LNLVRDQGGRVGSPRVSPLDSTPKFFQLLESCRTLSLDSYKIDYSAFMAAVLAFRKLFNLKHLLVVLAWPTPLGLHHVIGKDILA